jgi:hypothetical protein
MWVPSSADPRSSRSLRSPRPRPLAARRRRVRPGLQVLDDRLLLSSLGALVPSASFIRAHAAVMHQNAKTFNLVVSGPTSTGETAGDAFRVTIEAEESSGNTNTGDNHSITLTSSDGQTVIALPIKLKKGKATVSVILDRADSTTLIATQGSVEGTSSRFTVRPAAAASFVLSADPSDTAGSPFFLLVTAVDAYGNIATGYHGTAKLTTSDGQKVSPGTVSFSSSSGTPGMATVVVTLDEPDELTLNAAAGSIRGTSGHVDVEAATYSATLGGWTGYTCTPGSGVTAAGATWVQPAVSGSGNGDTSMWVGIDGWNDPTVEQCGVNASLVNGAPEYNAWFEFFGDESSSGAKGPDYYVQDLPSQDSVDAGDTISAEVSFVPGGNSREFLLQMADATQGWTWSLYQTMEYVTPQRATAEWIVESATANFGEITFTGAWASVNSASGPINPLKNLLAISTTYQGGAPRTTTTNPPVIANSLGYSEPASGRESSSFTVFYSSDTGNSDNVAAAQTSATVVNAASRGLAALDSDNSNTGSRHPPFISP